MKKFAPWIFFAVFAGWILASLTPPREKSAFHFNEFGRLPVLLNGRVQPLDSVARNTLLKLRGKQTAPVKLHFSIWNSAKRGETMSAVEWLLEVLMKSEVADTRKVFRVDHPDLVALLSLPSSDEEKGEDGKHFSANQLKPRIAELEKQARTAQEKEPEARDPFQRAVVKLFEGVTIYQRLKNSLQPEGTNDLAALLTTYETSIEPGVAAVHAQQRGEKYDEAAFDRILEFLSMWKFISDIAYPLLIPPANPDRARDAWTNIGTSLMESARGGEIHPAVQQFAQMSAAYRADKPAEFNAALAEYKLWLGGKLDREVRKARSEFFFNNLAPFYKSMVVYVIAFLLACSFWFNAAQWLRRSAFLLIALAFGVHTFGLIFRMVLEGRPPVTNLYSSAIFIGWGSVVLGMALEKFFKDAIGLVVAGVVGFTTLVIAHNLALGGDTMEMLRAVLDTNFWLATHVVAVTTGYAATFVAGFLAIIYIVRGALTRSLSETHAKSLARMVYGVVCFATLFSFVGTVLGGIWADQSWGRFWGWDPKENGALLIVIWNAAFLHARWGKVFPERGLMAMAVFGNIVTAFSWFGVNMLGIGLHSYGFMDAAFKWLIAFDATQIIVIAIALLPTRFGLSFRPGPAASHASKTRSDA